VRYPTIGQILRYPTSTFAQKQVVGSYDIGSMEKIDSYQVGLSPAYCGIESAILKLERAEGRSWFSTCITDVDGYMTLPRLATSITVPTWLSFVDAGLEIWTDLNTLTNWSWYESNAAFVLTRENIAFDTGAYSAKVTDNTGLAAGQWTAIYTSAANWSNNFRGLSVTCTVRVYNTDVTKAAAAVKIDDGISNTEVTSTTSGAWETLTCTRILNAAATKCEVAMILRKVTSSTSSCYFDSLSFPTTGTLTKGVNFNGSQYWAYGGMLMKLNAGRTAYTFVAAFPWDITDLIPSLNSCLYIFFGDSYQYRYMSTAEAITATTTATAAGGLSAWIGLQWDNKLWKMATTGTWYYTVTPNSATPTWTAGGSITDIAAQIERLFVGYDADGNSVMYCATNSILRVYDSTNALWQDTEVRLPNHPNGGKGAAYWNGGHYLSYGLEVKAYFPADARCIDVGLNQDDGIPLEYNGEITAFGADASSNVLFMLVDASQISGIAKSSLWAYDGRGYKCWWVDSANDGAMHHVFVSSASSAYGVYWDVGGLIYYIDLPRGTSNPTMGSTLILQDEYNTGDDNATSLIAAFSSNSYLCQSFTPASSHTLTKVRLKLLKTGSPGTVTVGVYASSGDLPTGAALCSGNLDGNNLTTSTTGEWYFINMTGGAALTASTKYVIKVTISATSGYLNTLQWRIKQAASYAGGYVTNFFNGSAIPYVGFDAMFEEYSGIDSYYFNSSGQCFTPSLSLGWTVGNKIIMQLRCLVGGDVSSNETVTIFYRLNSSFHDLTNGWIQLGSTITSSGETTLVFPDSTTPSGITCNSIQFRIDLARGATSTLTPIVIYLCLDYYKVIPRFWGWDMTLDLTKLPDYHDKTPAQLIEELITAYETETLVTFVWKDETKYVRVENVEISHDTGDIPIGQAKLILTEVRRA
jgi:hypothetical protein